MTKLYALVRPAVYQKQKISFFDTISSLVMQPYYIWQYETVCGFRLSHQPFFYRSLADAKQNFHSDPVIDGYTFSSTRAQQNAIIEMEMEEDTITGFSMLHRVTLMDKEQVSFYIDEDEGIIENRLETVICWQEIAIEPTDVSAGALNDMNQRYQKQQADTHQTVSVLR